jgi:hypothetical protein
VRTSTRPRIGLALAGLSALAALSLRGAARADDVDACAGASEQGQDLRDQGHLRAARAQFVTCAAQRCPAVVQKDCAEWLAAVDDALPTVIVHAHDGAGRDLTEVRVTVDGEVIAERLDGRALPVDPGEHTFRFSAAGAPEQSRKLVLHEREKGRPVEVVLGAPPPPPPVGTARPFAVPAPAWVLGGVSLAAFGALAAFGVSAKTAVDDMRASCAPGCPESRVDDARRDMIAANVALGAGVLALGAAAVLVIVRNAEPAKKPPAVTLRAGAGGLSLSGSF